MEKIDVENHFYSQCLIDELIRRNEPLFCTEDESTIYWTSSIDMPQEKILPLALIIRMQVFRFRNIQCLKQTFLPIKMQVDGGL